ncbi:MAG: hypothetical protein NG747_10800 [Candidatus Brocadia sp.]|nr:hypothetical protein [Candidatus Brocadia sp.]
MVSFPRRAWERDKGGRKKRLMPDAHPGHFPHPPIPDIRSLTPINKFDSHWPYKSSASRSINTRL